MRWNTGLLVHRELAGVDRRIAVPKRCQATGSQPLTAWAICRYSGMPMVTL